jgi:hypothetical protein
MIHPQVPRRNTKNNYMTLLFTGHSKYLAFKKYEILGRNRESRLVARKYASGSGAITGAATATETEVSLEIHPLSSGFHIVYGG